MPQTFLKGGIIMARKKRTPPEETNKNALADNVLSRAQAQ
jgi:hypothetical protein